MEENEFNVYKDDDGVVYFVGYEHGESKYWNTSGNLLHEYIFPGGYIDLLEQNITEEYKMFIKLKHGGEWISE